VTTLLRERQAAQQAAKRKGSRSAPAGDGTVVEVAGHRQLTALRKELHSLVGAWARKAGQPHGAVHAELRRTCGGPEVPQADAAQLQQRIDTLRSWFVRKRTP
jgi:hypothetical protein